MVAEVVEVPKLKAIAVQYLLAHAEQPSLLSTSTIPQLREFAKREPFLDEFLKLVHSRVGYSEVKLFNTEWFMPQSKFVEIQDCFKEITGINNPAHYREFGRIVPSLSSPLLQLASRTFGPAGVINASSRYNTGFNNDQQIVIEELATNKGLVEAVVQHYFLPRTKDNPAYREMVDAALGYWEGVPGLWGFPVRGDVQMNEIQIPLDTLVEHDYKYLGLNYNEKGNAIRINGETIGEKVPLNEVLAYDPRIEFLEKPTSEYTPVRIMENVIIKGDTIFREGELYGMPCNRYTVKIPNIGFFRRMGFAISQFVKDRQQNSEKDTHRITITRPEDITAFELLGQADRANQDKLQADLDKEKANREAAEAKAAEAKAREEAANVEKEAAEARVYLQEQVSGANRIFGHVKGLAHDDKNSAIAINGEAIFYLDTLIARYNPEYHTQHGKLATSPQELGDIIGQVMEFPSIDDHVLEFARLTNQILGKTSEIVVNSKDIMSGGIETKLEDFYLADVVMPIIEAVRKVHPTVEISYVAPEETSIYQCDRRQIKIALTNLIENAASASVPGGRVAYVSYSQSAGGRNLSINHIFQTGVMSDDVEHKLNIGEQFSTKGDKGNATGALASKSIIEQTHNGTLRYISLMHDNLRSEMRKRRIRHLPRLQKQTPYQELVQDYKSAIEFVF